MMRVGFTGTQSGMAMTQVVRVVQALTALRGAGATHANHGMCVGADAQFHDLARPLGYTLVGWPGVTNTGTVTLRARVACDEVMPVKFFLDRNRDIVHASSVLLVTPLTGREQLRSGTWATVRYARKVKLPLVLIDPAGAARVEHVPGIDTLDAYCDYLGNIGSSISV
jgi:hypothetical protein